jgi:hypothetical protein
MRTLTTILLFSIFLFGPACSDKSTEPTPPTPPSQPDPVTLEELLDSLPGAAVTELSPPGNSHITRVFQIDLQQPVDHDNPAGQQFTQRIYLSHAGDSLPVVLVTWGYSIGSNRIWEPTDILGANQIYVGHRYFGSALPTPTDWTHLNAEQAAADHHRITELFKELYVGDWVNYGISKGGRSALMHRRFYPDDVVATVAQVAPLFFTTADPRTDDFLTNQVGTSGCRQSIRDFQRLALERKDELLPLYESFIQAQGYTFRISLEELFELAVLEYGYVFWQYGPYDCNAIPGEAATALEIYTYLQTTSEIDYLREDVVVTIEPAYYQFYTQLGYYGFVTDHVADLLSNQNLSYALFCPPGVPLVFDPSVSQDLDNWLATNGNNIIYIYGEVDPITAVGVELSGQTNAIKIVEPGQNHMVMISDLTTRRQEVIDSLNAWVN